VELPLDPLGAYRLLGLPMAELSGQLVDLAATGALGQFRSRRGRRRFLVWPEGTQSEGAPMTQAVAQPVVRWRLRTPVRKSVLLVHIASAGAWLGIDVVMGVLVFTALFSDDDRTKALSFRALELVAVGPLLTLGLICLVTGVLLGLSSKYGLLRFWWVAVKLALNLILTGLVLVALAPQVADSAERARQFDAGVPAPLGVGDLIFPPIVSPTALLVAMVLAVFKPWGRIRSRQPTAREE
jgi:hypothetical protein